MRALAGLFSGRTPYCESESEWQRKRRVKCEDEKRIDEDDKDEGDYDKSNEVNQDSRAAMYEGSGG